MWTALWIIWILAFFVIEGAALFRRAPGDTLSEHLRSWFHTDQKLGRWIWLVTTGIFAAWLITHIAVNGSV